MNTSKGGEHLKKCCRCGVLKDESEFHKCKQHKDGLKSACKQCSKITSKLEYSTNKKLAERGESNWKQFDLEQRRQETKRRLERNRILIESLKTNCRKCNDSRKYVIQFHHVDPSTKLFTLSGLTSHGEAAFRDEAKKCVCLCSNCHFEFHHLYGKRPKNPVEALTEYLDEGVKT